MIKAKAMQHYNPGATAGKNMENDFILIQYSMYFLTSYDQSVL